MMIDEKTVVNAVGIVNYLAAENDKTIKIKETFKSDYGMSTIVHYDVFDKGLEYLVIIGIYYNSINKISCTCDSYNVNKKCVHVAKAFNELFKIENKDPNLSIEKFQKQLSGSFFQEIKEKTKLNVKLILVFDDYSVGVKVKIGEDKVFAVGNKLIQIKDNFQRKNGTVVFSKSFTFDAQKHTFSPDDANIILYLANLNERQISSERRTTELSDIEFISFIKLIGDKTFDIESVDKNVDKIRFEPPMELQLNEKDEKYNFNFNYEGVKVLSSDFMYMYKNKTLFILPEKIRELLYNMSSHGFSDLVLDKENALKFSKNVYPSFKDRYKIEEKLADEFAILTPKVKLYFDCKTNVEAKVIFEYNKNEVNYFDKEAPFRNDLYESTVIDDLLNYKFEKGKNKFEIKKINDIVDFIDSGIYRLREKYSIYTTEKFDNTSLMKTGGISSHFSIGKDNIMTYDFNLEGIKPNELSKLFGSMKEKEKYYKLSNGQIINTDDQNIQELYKVCDNLNLDEYESTGVVPKYRALYLDSVKDYGIVNLDSNFKGFVNNFNKFKNADVSLSKKDDSILRDYQKEGVRWLYNIYKCGFGGVLADEMGLGKTIQTIMFIKNVLKEKKDAKILIVAPTSLIYNWEHEFDVFGKELDYRVIASSKNQRAKELEDDTSIVITTYGLLRQDQEIYKDKHFELIIIDEAQNIKNPKAGISQAVKKLSSNINIALTGTPVENSVLEVWSIFDFIMPGYLNSLSNFQEKYNIKDMDEEAQNQLRDLTKSIAPFIQRRRKKEVLNDLPDKVENIIYLDLLPEQKKYYAAQVKKTQEEMDEIIKTEGINKARFKILTLLTKLRQLCIHPKIVFEDFKDESVKIVEIVNLVQNYVDNGHKVLIFTSFKSGIDVVKEKFDENKISNYVIDGSVKSKTRNDLVNAFNKDNTNAFLITLKSGGTGLNLTSADVVIHLDLWWNPQAENQATDRAHRIGQKNSVEVVKLVCKGTIEEKILELQEKKKILNDTLIDCEDINEAVLSKLDESDIRDLLSLSE